MNLDHPIVKRLDNPRAQKLLYIILFLGWLVSFYYAVNRQLHGGSADFREFYRVTRQTVYGEADSARGLRVGFTYPPFFHVLISGFSWMPLWLAASLWHIFCSGLAVASVVMLYRLCREDDEPLPFVFLAVPVTMGLGLIFNDLIMGNSNLVVMFCIVLGLYLFRSKRDMSAGIALAAGTALKLMPGIFFFYFLYKRRYRVVAGMAAGAILFFLAFPVIRLGPAGGAKLIREWTAQMAPLVGKKGPNKNIWYMQPDIYRGTNQSIPAVLNRMLRPIGAIRGQNPKGKVNIADLSPRAVNAIYIVLAIAILGGAAFLLRLPTEPNRRFMPLTLEYSLVLLVMLLLNRVTWVNYLVHLTLPYFAAFHYLRRAPRHSRPHRITQFCLILSFSFAVMGAAALTQAYAFPLMGALALGVAISYDLWFELKTLPINEAPSG